MLKYLSIPLIVLTLSLGTSTADDNTKKTQPKGPSVVIEELLNSAVTLKFPSGQAFGSGFVINKGDYSWILTAGHCVEPFRRVAERIDPKTGSKKEVIEFDDARVYQIDKQDGRIVGQAEWDAEVLRYSDAEYGEDLALLRVRKKKAFPYSAKLYLDKDIPGPGTEIFHVGSMMGEIGANSLTTGIVSQNGRINQGQASKVIYDQVSCVSFPGSSGGLISLKNGQVIGMVVRGPRTGGGFALVVPVRRMVDWMKRVGLEFLLDNNMSIPSDEELRKLPIEDSLRSSNFKENTTTPKTPGGSE